MTPSRPWSGTRLERCRPLTGSVCSGRPHSSCVFSHHIAVLLEYIDFAGNILQNYGKGRKKAAARHGGCCFLKVAQRGGVKKNLAERFELEV